MHMDGRSRQLGFIGFKSVEQAATALRYFDRSYMDTSKLAVEYARKVGDNQLPRAWSKHTAGTTANRKVTGPGAGAAVAADDKAAAGAGAEGKAAAAAAEGAKAAKGKKGKKGGEPLPEEEDPKLREFLALMQPRSKARIWGNDELPTAEDGAAAAAAAAAAAQAAAKKQAARSAAAGGMNEDDDGDDDDDDDDQYQDWTEAAARARRAGSGDGSDDEEMADAAGGGGGSDGEGGSGGGGGGGVRDEVVVNVAVSDLEYLRSRMRRWDEEDDEEEKEEDKGRRAGEEEEEEEDAAAAARGDQTGVGTSPRCAATAAGAAGKKAGGKKAAAGAAAERPRGRSGDAGTGGSDDPDADGDGDVDMADPADRDPGRRQGRGPSNPDATGGGDGGSGGDGEEEGILETGRLFVRNLAYTAREADLSDLFGAFGDLQEVHLVMDRETKRSKGLAYVQYQIPEDAVRAAQQLDGTIYQGRLLHILPAKRAPSATAAAAAAATAAAAAAAATDGGVEGGVEQAADGERAERQQGRPGSTGGGRPGTSSFKAQREAQRKADAGNRAAWNTLFMRPDTVADAVAAHYGLSKAALLDPSAAAGGGGGRGGDSVAVRMALGEAQVIAATKQALAEAGVSVEALEAAAAASGKAATTKSVARSSTTLLVKNLPYSADEDELAELFGRCGPIARLVLPPARALALVEFTEPQDARAAFRSLAYKKYHHVPLYLEWAPADVFTAPAPPRNQDDTQAGGQQQQQQAARAAKPGGKGAKAAAPDPAALAASADADADGAGGGGSGAVVGTIYVKNLSFATVDAGLRKHFDGAVSAAGGCLHSAVVARKKAPEAEAKGGSKKGAKKGGQEGGVLSLGYGFVEVDSEEVAAAVIKKLQGSMLDGHKLALQLSRGRKAQAAGAAAPAKAAKKEAEGDGSTKLVVRNLAFEATKKDIQGLFNPFGHLKSCRLPKKFDGSHRGFAFVEFVTKQEARNALEGVGGTHLYGRRLVVEYAREDDTLDDIRNKTAAKFKRDGEIEAGEAPAKRLKV
ncbi:hypothetical protein PLESTF_001030300 [Pleodorina starrii]|nr:hypothetical protein PLESTF_001030300 [Pleodorina starrii]